jgi:transposase InsO family protein
LLSQVLVIIHTVFEEAAIMSQKVIDTYLSNIYYNTKAPGSYGGVTKLWKSVKAQKDRPKGLNLAAVKAWLNLQSTYSVHRKPKSNFDTEKVIYDGIDTEWQTDLIDISNISKFNKNKKFLLVIIDCFSRYAWVKPLKSKRASETAAAFENVIEESGRHCDVLRSDAGPEYRGKDFQKMLEKHNISHILCYGSTKAAMVERLNETLLNRFAKIFYQQDNFNLLNILDDVVYSYNHTIHSTIGMKPADVTENNARSLYEKIYLPILKKRANEKVKFSFYIGQLVRLSHGPETFRKGYKSKWTEEVFKVRNLIPSHPPRYKLSDLRNNSLKGSFYMNELLPLPVQDVNQIPFKIEKVVSYKKIKGINYKEVKWKGYDKSFNSLLSPKEFLKYKKK